MQTGATALLGAAAVTALYGVFHLFDLRRPKPAVEFEPQRVEFDPQPNELEPQPIEFEPAAQADVRTRQDARALLAAVDQQLATERQPVADVPVEAVEPAAPKASSGRKGKTSRKSSGRSTSTARKAKAAELPPQDEVANVTELLPQQVVAEDFGPVVAEDVPHVQPAPLFEPDPFSRAQRPAFGRRAGFGRRADIP